MPSAPPSPPPLPPSGLSEFGLPKYDRSYSPPVLSPTGPPGAYVVELILFNGWPFKDHWAYWIGEHINATVGVVLQATGNVRDGFTLEAKRNHDLVADETRPTSRIPLQWVDARHFDATAMLDPASGNAPACPFEASAHKIEAPAKTLNSIDDRAIPGKRVNLRNCQTWIVESADQLVKDSIFRADTAAYLHAVEQ